MRFSSSLSHRALALAGAATLAMSAVGAVVGAPTADATAPTGHDAIVLDTGCTQNAFPRIDDTSRNFGLPFSLDWFGRTYNNLWVNSNGGVNLAAPWSAYSHLHLDSIAQPVITPLFTDLDTRNVTTNVGTDGVIADYNGHRAFCANWVNVGHFSNSGPMYSAQLLIVDRSDIAVGDVDVIFNYDWVKNDSDAVTVGYAAADGTSYEFPGSGTSDLEDGGSKSLVNNTLNSGGQLGRYTFPVRDGHPPRAQTITFSNPGPQLMGTILTPGATASSGLGVSYAASGPCHVSGNRISLDRIGTCTVTASQPGNLNASPAYNGADDVTVSFDVGAPPVWIDGTPPRGTVGHTYRFLPNTHNGFAPYQWWIGSGALPDGLHIDRATGVITGTPTKSGASHAVIMYTDANGSIATSAVLTFNVDAPVGIGYRLAGHDGGVFAFGAAPFAGSLAEHRLAGPIVAVASPANAPGYFLVGSDGGVFGFGGARYAGSLAGHRLPAPVVGMATTVDGSGYWLVTANGAVYPFGTARSFGRITTDPLHAPVAGIAATPDGHGYWLATRTGRLYGLGSARAAGQFRATKPIVGVASKPTGYGGWLVTSAGDVIAFGDAQTYGVLPGAVRQALHVPVVGITVARGGRGYWLVASNSAVFSFGSAPFLGNAGGVRLHASIVGIAAGP